MGPLVSRLAVEARPLSQNDLEVGGFLPLWKVYEKASLLCGGHLSAKQFSEACDYFFPRQIVFWGKVIIFIHAQLL
jgi:hypothetical protein